MKVEIRSDGLHLTGYVNVTEKMSRPVITGKGQKVIEVIEPRAFERALERVGNVVMTKDHNPDYTLAEMRTGNLTLHEDAIGLYADAIITDEPTIAEARAGKLKGWSFGMKNIIDKIEERSDALPIRRVSSLDLDHITLVVNQIPAYAATSIEMRANEEISEIEFRTAEDIQIAETATLNFDNTEFKNRINSLKSAK